MKNIKYNVKSKIITQFKKLCVICSKLNKITNANLKNNFKRNKIKKTCNIKQNLKASRTKINKTQIKNFSNKTNNNNNNHILTL